MGDQASGWVGDKLVVFDPKLLDDAAARLKQHNSGPQLTNQLQDALAPPGAFGEIDGGLEASNRLAEVITGLKTELHKVGVDMNDLAVRTLAARDAAFKANAETEAAARRSGPN